MYSNSETCGSLSLCVLFYIYEPFTLRCVLVANSVGVYKSTRLSYTRYIKEHCNWISTCVNKNAEGKIDVGP